MWKQGRNPLFSLYLKRLFGHYHTIALPSFPFLLFDDLTINKVKNNPPLGFSAVDEVPLANSCKMLYQDGVFYEQTYKLADPERLETCGFTGIILV